MADVARIDQRYWASVLQELVRIPSEFEQEQAMVARVEELIRDTGANPVRVPHLVQTLEKLPEALRPFSTVNGRYSLAVRIPGSGGGRSLMLNAHLDIAPPGDASAWSAHPFSGHLDAATGRIHGRGVMDDKAGVVILLAVLSHLQRSSEQRGGDVIFHFVLEDEITGNGTLLCLQTGARADAAFIVDGTRLDRAIREHAGQLEFEVTFTGRPASVSVSHLGTNAAEVLARLTLELREFYAALNDARPQHWRCFPTPYQCSVQRLASEGGAFTVPEHGRARFFSTFCPPDSLATMKRRIEDFIAQFARRHALPQQPELNWNFFHTEPVESVLPGELVALLENAGATAGPSTGTSDLRHYISAGIPCVLYGPGGGQNPHRADEFYPVADLSTMASFYLQVIRAWCGPIKFPSP